MWSVGEIRLADLRSNERNTMTFTSIAIELLAAGAFAWIVVKSIKWWHDNVGP